MVYQNRPGQGTVTSPKPCSYKKCASREGVAVGVVSWVRTKVEGIQNRQKTKQILKLLIAKQSCDLHLAQV